MTYINTGGFDTTMTPQHDHTPVQKGNMKQTEHNFYWIPAPKVAVPGSPALQQSTGIAACGCGRWVRWVSSNQKTARRLYRYHVTNRTTPPEHRFHWSPPKHVTVEGRTVWTQSTATCSCKGWSQRGLNPDSARDIHWQHLDMQPHTPIPNRATPRGMSK